jgi:hypothetical protein
VKFNKSGKYRLRFSYLNKQKKSSSSNVLTLKKKNVRLRKNKLSSVSYLGKTVYINYKLKFLYMLQNKETSMEKQFTIVLKPLELN